MTILALHCTCYQWEADFVGPIRQAEQPKILEAGGGLGRLQSFSSMLAARSDFADTNMTLCS